MTDAGYIFAGWGLVFGGVALYAVRIVVRGRNLSKRVAPERRRWM